MRKIDELMLAGQQDRVEKKRGLVRTMNDVNPTGMELTRFQALHQANRNVLTRFGRNTEEIVAEINNQED